MAFALCKESCGCMDDSFGRSNPWFHFTSIKERRRVHNQQVRLIGNMLILAGSSGCGVHNSLTDISNSWYQPDLYLLLLLPSSPSCSTLLLFTTSISSLLQGQSHLRGWLFQEIGTISTSLLPLQQHPAASLVVPAQREFLGTQHPQECEGLTLAHLYASFPRHTQPGTQFGIVPVSKFPAIPLSQRNTDCEPLALPIGPLELEMCNLHSTNLVLSFLMTASLQISDYFMNLLSFSVSGNKTEEWPFHNTGARLEIPPASCSNE